MDRLVSIVSFFLHFDTVLANVIQQYGTGTYVFLFAIIFCETGLIVTPFLPGDSLLFAAGALSARGLLRLSSLLLICSVAAIGGDALNYAIGRHVGLRAFRVIEGRILERRHLEHAERFYKKHGGRAITLSRFLPIIRTLAPFLAGVSHMPYGEFVRYNIIGGLLWVFVFVFGGYFFGGIKLVQENFSLVIVAILFISLAPIGKEVWLARREKKRQVQGDSK